MKTITLLPLLLGFIMLTGCNDTTPKNDEESPQVEEEPSKKALALRKITLYADNSNNPKPTLQDYLDVGVIGITAENLEQINLTIEALSKNDVDTTDKINALVQVINTPPQPTAKAIAQAKIIAYTNNSNNLKPTLQDYLDAGAIGVNSENLESINNIIASLSKNEVDSIKKINSIIKSINSPTPIATMIIENGEDNITSRWKKGENYSGQSQFKNIYDKEKSSRVIEFTSGGFYDAYSLKFPTHSNNLSKIKWEMKWLNKLYEIQLIINTTQGVRRFSYLAKDTGDYIENTKAIYALGSNADNEEWHTITRDIEVDLHRYEPNNDFISIDQFIVYGSGYIDNIELYEKSTPIQDISYPTVVPAPGIVLTFDDSIINDWYAMKQTFQEKGVHATFFCNNWENLGQEKVAKFRELQNDGHEIAVHTKDHLSTYDGKYRDSDNKAQAYFDDQVLPAIEAMNRDYFNPTSFSYPFISGQPKHNDVIRKQLPHIREFFSIVNQIDNPNETTYSFSEIQKVLLRLKETQNIGVFLAHRILPAANPDSYKYRITTEKLIQVIDEVNRLGLKFYTLEEAHRVYLQP